VLILDYSVCDEKSKHLVSEIMNIKSLTHSLPPLKVTKLLYIGMEAAHGRLGIIIKKNLLPMGGQGTEWVKNKIRIVGFSYRLLLLMVL
jgi:hypothetical protein